MRQVILVITIFVSSLSAVFGQGEFKTMWCCYNNNTIDFVVSGTGPITYSWTTVGGGAAITGSGVVPFSSNMILSISNLPPNRIIEISILPQNISSFKIAYAGNGNSTPIALDSVTQWGTANWTSMESAFEECNYVSISNSAGAPNLGLVQNMAKMFFRCNRLNDSDLSSWDMSNVTRMDWMFYEATDFVGDISTWDVSNVLNMALMFSGASNFNGDISSWNVANVQNMFEMFSLTSYFDGDISSWDVSNVQNMGGMFRSAANFDQDLSQWDISNVNRLSSFGTNAFGFLDYSGLSCENYSNFLVGQANNPNLPSGLFLGATSLQYGNDAIAARNTLINSKGWTITGDSPSGFDCLSAPLPVELLELSVSRTQNGHLLSWSTATEIDNSHFIIEHSTTTGSDDSFKAISTVAGQGTTSEMTAYEYTHYTGVAGTHYYRLKQVDFDGVETLSDVVAVNQKETSEIAIFPNPVNQALKISGISTGDIITLTNALGRVVLQDTYDGQMLAIEHLPAGTYFLHCQEAGREFTRRFIKL